MALQLIEPEMIAGALRFAVSMAVMFEQAHCTAPEQAPVLAAIAEARRVASVCARARVECDDPTEPIRNQYFRAAQLARDVRLGFECGYYSSTAEAAREAAIPIKKDLVLLGICIVCGKLEIAEHEQVLERKGAPPADVALSVETLTNIYQARTALVLAAIAQQETAS